MDDGIVHDIGRYLKNDIRKGAGTKRLLKTKKNGDSSIN